MIINKITVGYVVQKFDTEKEKFIEQKFVAEDEVYYEDNVGNFNLPDTEVDKVRKQYLLFEMQQPID